MYASRLLRVYFGDVKSTNTVYRRQMPSQLVRLDCEEGKVIFRESLEEGHCQSFFTWIQQFITQSQLSTCASASLAMMLNTLKVDPGVNWKGIWRWYDDYNIKHISTAQIKEGMTLEEFNTLAILNSARSLAFSPLEGISDKSNTTVRQSTFPFFRSCLAACTKSNRTLMTLNFCRQSLRQTGNGHFSPIAAFNAQRNMALVLDVAKFKYDSYWCPTQTLYESLKPLDSVSKQSRGFILNAGNYEIQNDETKYLKVKAEQGIKDVDIMAQFIQNLNDHSWNQSLINFLFDYSTYHFEGLKQLISQGICSLGLHQDHHNNLTDKMSTEIIFLLDSFKRQDRQELLRLLYIASYLSTSITPQNPQGIKPNRTAPSFNTVLQFLRYSLSRRDISL